MMRVRSWGVRTRLILAFAGVLVPYLALAGIGAAGFRLLWQRVDAMREEVVADLRVAANLQVALLNLLMPANDYLSTGDPAERDRFEQRLARVHEILARLEGVHAQHGAEERQLFAAVRRELLQIEALSRQILAVPDPRGDQVAAATMRALDQLGERAAADLDRVRQISEREMMEEIEGGLALIRRLIAVGFVAVLLSVAGGMALALIFAGWVGRPILAIAESSRRMAAGDLAQRVEVRAGGELGEAARAFNEMAARLAASTKESARLYAEAEAQRARLGSVMESAHEAIIIADGEGIILSWNKGARTIFGYADGEAVGQSLTMLMPERYREAHRTGLERFPATGATVELTGLRKGGAEFPVELSLVSWRLGDATFYSGIARDITERKQVERMKSDFVSFATHQLRTPLAGIKWMLELAAQGAEVPAETRSYLQDAREANERLIRLVNDLLDATRLESGRLAIAPQETHLGELTRSVVEEVGPLIRERGHRLSVTGGEALPPLWLDPQLLRQVVLNLVSNAIKYTPPGGEIAIRMTRDGESVSWVIQDSGVGIPKGAQGRLFEKFFRAENALTMETEGTGLGLYLVRLIVERFGGRISSESEEGRGSTFTVTLPLPD